ncbi:MAG: hypothetical protein ACAI44_16925 [Candidatus Sericytochromatia bacterium]
MPKLKLLLMPLALAGCQVRDPVTELVRAHEPAARRAYYATVSQQATPAAIRVEIRLTAGFRTQLANQNGVVAGRAAAIQAFRLFLVSLESPLTSGSLVPLAGPFTLPANLTEDSQALIFRNLLPGTYSVCAAAFDLGSEFTPASNLTSAETGYSYAEGPCAPATGGGLDDSGRVEVRPDYSLAGTAQLQIQLPLRPAAGASFDTRVQVIESDILD